MTWQTMCGWKDVYLTKYYISAGIPVFNMVLMNLLFSSARSRPLPSQLNSCTRASTSSEWFSNFRDWFVIKSAESIVWKPSLSSLFLSTTKKSISSLLLPNPELFFLITSSSLIKSTTSNSLHLYESFLVHSWGDATYGGWLRPLDGFDDGFDLLTFCLAKVATWFTIVCFASVFSSAWFCVF